MLVSIRRVDDSITTVKDVRLFSCFPSNLEFEEDKLISIFIQKEDNSFVDFNDVIDLEVF